MGDDQIYRIYWRGSVLRWAASRTFVGTLKNIVEAMVPKMPLVDFSSMNPRFEGSDRISRATAISGNQSTSICGGGLSNRLYACHTSRYSFRLYSACSSSDSVMNVAHCSSEKALSPVLSNPAFRWARYVSHDSKAIHSPVFTSTIRTFSPWILLLPSVLSCGCLQRKWIIIFQSISSPRTGP